MDHSTTRRQSKSKTQHWELEGNSYYDFEGLFPSFIQSFVLLNRGTLYQNGGPVDSQYNSTWAFYFSNCGIQLNNKTKLNIRVPS